MKRRLSPVVVGAFALGALLLAAVALASFGAGRWFHDPVRFEIHIRGTSISGLEAGSQVKLRGVRIGRVESVSPRFDPEAGRFIIRVVCDIDERATRDLELQANRPSDDLVERLIAEGLQAKLNLGGITGMLYVDLFIEPTPEPIPVAYDAVSGVPIVPTAPSMLAEFTDSFSKIATGLAAVDFEGISTDLTRLLGQLNQTVAEVDLPDTLARVNAAANAVAELAGSRELTDSLVSLNAAARELRDVLGGLKEATPELREQLDAVLVEATRTLAQFSATAETLNGLLSPRHGLPQEFAESLESLQTAAWAIERLADYLERNPGALLRGRATHD